MKSSWGIVYLKRKNTLYINDSNDYSQPKICGSGTMACREKASAGMTRKGMASFQPYSKQLSSENLKIRKNKPGLSAGTLCLMLPKKGIINNTIISARCF
jgi:hypothetical protein